MEIAVVNYYATSLIFKYSNFILLFFRRGVVSMPTISHFHIPADDLERAKMFYADVFEWEFKDLMGSQWPVITKSGREHAIEGVLVQREKKNQRILNYIGVPSVDHYVNRVNMLGGRVINKKKLIPGKGYAALCADTENNIFCLWEEDEMAYK